MTVTILLAYFNFLTKAVQGDWGISFRQGRPVVDILIERLPATLELATISAILAIILGIMFGVYTAIRPKGWLTGFILTISLVGVSLPTFLIGVFLIWAFAVNLDLLPSFVQHIDTTGEMLRFQYDKHWDVSGNRLAAETIYNWLSQNHELQ